MQKNNATLAVDHEAPQTEHLVEIYSVSFRHDQRNRVEVVGR